MRPFLEYEGKKIVCNTFHYSDVKWESRHLNSAVSRLFFQQFVQADIKRNVKVPHYCPLWGNPPVTAGFPSQRASKSENVSIWWRHHVYTNTGTDMHKEKYGNYRKIKEIWTPVPLKSGHWQVITSRIIIIMCTLQLIPTPRAMLQISVNKRGSNKPDYLDICSQWRTEYSVIPSLAGCLSLVGINLQIYFHGCRWFCFRKPPPGLSVTKAIYLFSSGF